MSTTPKTDALEARIRKGFLRRCSRIMHTYRERVATILTNADARKKTELLQKLKK